MENKNSELRRRANLKRDIERQTDLTNHGFSPILVAIHSFICQICRLTDMYKRHVFGLFFLVLETGVAVLDGIGKGKSDLLLAAFVLSTIGFLITCCACVKRRARSTSTIEVPAVRQLRVVEFVFSSIQLIASLLQFLLAHLKDKKILDVENNIDASVFPVAFSMVAVVFIFKNDEAITNSSQDGSQQQVTVDRTGTSARNEDSPSISDIIHESSSATVLPPNNVPQEGSQQQVKRDLIETARNQDRPDKMTESSSATVVPANNVPRSRGLTFRKVVTQVLKMSSSSATVLPANNVPPPGRLTFGDVVAQVLKMSSSSAIRSTSNSPSADKSD